MAALTEHDKAYVYALELLRKQLEDNALGVAANTKATEDDYKARAKAIGDWMASKGAGAGDPSAGGFGGGPPVTAASKPPEDKTPGPGGIETKANSDAREAEQRAKFDADKRRGAETASKVNANPIMQVLGEVAGKFMSIIGPAAILSQMLNSTISGFGTLQMSVKIFASSLAPILLPATLLLSSVFLSLGEIVGEHGPLMEQFFAKMMALVPVVELVVQWFDEAADHIQDMADAANNAEKAIIEMAVAAYKKAQSYNPATTEEEDDAFIRRQFGGSGGERSRSEDKVERGLRDSLESLRRSIGPRASISSLGSVGQASQLAALNADPLEVKLLRDSLATLERIERKLPGRSMPGRVYDPERSGAGDYERGSGSGSGGDYGEGE